MACYRTGGCGPYEYWGCTECPASKPTYRQGAELVKAVEKYEHRFECKLENDRACTLLFGPGTCDPCRLLERVQEISDSAKEAQTNYEKIAQVMDDELKNPVMFVIEKEDKRVVRYVTVTRYYPGGTVKCEVLSRIRAQSDGYTPGLAVQDGKDDAGERCDIFVDGHDDLLAARNYATEMVGDVEG